MFVVVQKAVYHKYFFKKISDLKLNSGMDIGFRRDLEDRRYSMATNMLLSSLVGGTTHFEHHFLILNDEIKVHLSVSVYCRHRYPLLLIGDEFAGELSRDQQHSVLCGMASRLEGIVDIVFEREETGNPSEEQRPEMRHDPGYWGLSSRTKNYLLIVEQCSRWSWIGPERMYWEYGILRLGGARQNSLGCILFTPRKE